jgi:hypothetical protein
MRRLLLLSLALVVSAPAPLLAARGHFTKQELHVPGTTLWVNWGDLDGDGKTDLVVSYRRGAGPHATRFIAVFFRGEAGYPETPQIAYAAPKYATAFDVGDALPGGGEDLVYLAPDGVYAQAFINRRPGIATRIVTMQTVVGRAEEEDLLSWDFLRPLAPGGPPTLIVPTNGPIKLLQRQGSVFKPWCTVDVDTLNFYDAGRSTYRRSARGASSGQSYAFRATTIVPRLVFTDQTGDGKIDLVTLFEDRVAVFPMKEDGTLSSTASYQRWFELRTPRELAVQDTDISAEVADLDGDGVADVSLTKIGGGLTTMKTETYLYRGVKGGGFEKEPAQSFKEDGFAALIRYIDVDGDGKLEMVHPFSEVSVVAISRMLIARELTLDLRIRRRLGDPRGIFDNNPAQTIHNRIALDFSIGGALRGSYPLFGSDFDGDGIPDVVIAENADGLGVHRGVKKGSELFDDDAAAILASPATRETHLVPAGTAPGSPSDVLLIYVDRPELAGKLVLFRNEP